MKIGFYFQKVYLSKHRSILSDSNKIVHNCSKANKVTSELPVCNHSSRVSGSISDIALSLNKSKKKLVKQNFYNKISCPKT